MSSNAGAPYHEGDPIRIKDQEGIVREIKRTNVPQPFGLCWVLLVAIGHVVTTATVDDNGYDRARRVGPSDLVLA